MDTKASQQFPILIAEDNPVSRRLLERALAKAGYRVVSVADGRRAFEVLQKEFFPIVITDWMMPEMNGQELCRAIRGHTFPGYVFVMLLTSLDSKDDIIAGLEAGADDYLTKPFNQAELVARLNTGKRILELERSLRRANDEILHLSVTDPLTQIFNRGYINTHLPDEIARAKRYSRSLSVIMCDIDFFKKVNDTYGHQAGDSVLKAFASTIQGTIRSKVDWLARYGGEEFLVILPETDVQGAAIVGERLRAKVEQAIIPVGEARLSITASFGVTGFNQFPWRNITAEQVIEQADSLLYQAKRDGRNRIAVGPPLEAEAMTEEQ